MKLTSADHAVIKAFYDKDQAQSKYLMTNGQVLDGLWIGGSSIAEWDGGKIKFNDLGSTAAQTVQNAVKRSVPKNSLKQASTQRLASDVLRELEMRVAKLERQASWKNNSVHINIETMRGMQNWIATKDPSKVKSDMTRSGVVEDSSHTFYEAPITYICIDSDKTEWDTDQVIGFFYDIKHKAHGLDNSFDEGDGDRTRAFVKSKIGN